MWVGITYCMPQRYGAHTTSIYVFYVSQLTPPNFAKLILPTFDLVIFNLQEVVADSELSPHVL